MKKLYTVTARVVVIKDIEISAESLEDAVEQSKSLQETDFVDVGKDGCNDGSIRIISVSVPNAWNVD